MNILKALIYFDELVRSRSMRAAADSLGVAPTAVSRQIEQLEAYFEADLVERSARGVKLTPAGDLLATHAGRTLREFLHVGDLIRDLKGLQHGSVSIYANGATVTSVLAPALAAFSLSYPKLRFKVTIGSASEAVAAIREAEADIAVALFAPPLAETEVKLRCDIDYDLILPAGHPIALSDRPVRLDALSDLPLALPEASFGFRQAFNILAERLGLRIEPTFTVSSLEMLRELVLSGAAVTLLPSVSLRREIDSGLLAAVPLVPDHAIVTHLDLCVSPDRPLSFAAGKLVDFIQRFMPSTAAQSIASPPDSV